MWTFNDRVAVVTGGSRGIGKAVALGLQEHGATVAILARGSDSGRGILPHLARPELLFQVDVSNDVEVRKTLATIETQADRIDILVNCAGSLRTGPALSLELDDWQDVLDSHLTGVFLCAREAAKRMISSGRGGRIVNVGSIRSLFGGLTSSHYAAAKAGVLGLTRALAVEFGQYGITVNALLPGHIRTKWTAKVSEQTIEETSRRTPLHRWGEPSDLVGPALFLASDSSAFVTGAVLAVDGGYTICDRLIYDSEDGNEA